MTVNKERLINAQNEPQNWLIENGDYGSQRYSKLTAATDPLHLSARGVLRRAFSDAQPNGFTIATGLRRGVECAHSTSTAGG